MVFLTCHVARFAVYDFLSTQRKSYYPHNEPITTVVRSSDTEQIQVVQSVSNTLVPTMTIGERSQAGSPGLDSTWHQHMPSMPL